MATDIHGTKKPSIAGLHLFYFEGKYKPEWFGRHPLISRFSRLMPVNSILQWRTFILVNQ